MHGARHASHGSRRAADAVTPVDRMVESRPALHIPYASVKTSAASGANHVKRSET